MNENIYFCNEDHDKKFKVKFDSGLLEKDDIWFLCKKCNLKPEFQQYRIICEIIRNKEDKS